MLAVFGGTIGRHGLVVAGVCESRVVPTRVQCSSVPTRDRKAKVMRMMMARRGEARRGDGRSVDSNGSRQKRRASVPV